jgi:hypothetical protein
MRLNNKSGLVTDRLISLGWHPLPPEIFAKIENDFQTAVSFASIKIAAEITPETILKAARVVAGLGKQKGHSFPPELPQNGDSR